MAEKFKVLFGVSAEEDVLIGRLEPGNATTKGTVLKGKFRKGNYIFPNKTKAWGVRLIDGKVPTDKKGNTMRIEVTQPEYKGEVQWLEWGDPKGYMIESRYEEGTASLDYQYQINRLKLAPTTEDLENNYLSFPTGYNEFEVDVQGVLVQHLKIHNNNRDSKSKNPDAKFPVDVFSEVREFNTREFEAKEIDTAWDAVKIVKEATTFEKLKVLRTILADTAEIVYDQAKENSLYDSLILFAGNQPKDFLDAVSSYKESVSKLISLGKAYEVFDTTLNGSVWVTQPTKELLFENIPAKGEAMLDWMYDNCLEPPVYEALEKLNLFSKKFKQ